MKVGMCGDLYDFQAGDEIKDFRGVTKAVLEDRNGQLYLKYLDKTGMEIFVGEPGETTDVAMRAVWNTFRCVW